MFYVPEAQHHLVNESPEIRARIFAAIARRSWPILTPLFQWRIEKMMRFSCSSGSRRVCMPCGEPCNVERQRWNAVDEGAPTHPSYDGLQRRDSKAFQHLWVRKYFDVRSYKKINPQGAAHRVSTRQ